MHTAASESGFDLTLKRNCSISPHDLLWVLAFAACVSLGIGAGFALLGAWPILPFAGLEVLALAAAFYVNGRHAADYERIALSGERLLVEASDAGRIELHEFNPRRLRIDERRLGRELRLLLRSSGTELEIGRHLDAERRASLAARLRRSLSRCWSDS
ncbi:MAG TPA: DUF2244 domain-containing protein [Burkholderiales bacterium]|nr:DUF2244 domain-containing protein [Burkholderiales bacterium]